MSERKEVAIIPKGSYVSIMGCRFTLLEDTQIEANQANLDYILKEQKNFDEGIGVVGDMPSHSTSQKPP
ncbi:hypothetical protein RFI02_02050 [Acinetobacter sichuanensis]|uniref:hypothetical protein n=1 Tax=Acinetobacter sichuanensis TaxID=2136183 RepID=UPI00280DA14E|nr:hypothetical protein [Acinetobacter sichuanensis]MDQ9019882.1 hypothetical protein [Acinetobacter sichuanensis]